MPPRKGKGAEEKSAKKLHKKGDPIPSRSARVAALVESFNKEMKGRAEIYASGDISLPYLTKRLPTGLLSLDLALRGGFPAAGISQIIGPKNSGKSYITWQIVRQLQAMLGKDMHVLFAMTEMRADRGQGRKAGVAVAYSDEDIASFDRARVSAGYPKYTKEEIAALKFEIGHIHELYGMSGEELYDGVLRAVDENGYQLIVIDSIGMVMSGAEAEAESLTQKTYGGAAGVNTQFLHKLTNMLLMKNKYGQVRDTCLIGINQIRDAIGDPHKEYKSSGGRALEHAKFVDLFVSSGTQMGHYDNLFAANESKKVWVQTGKEVNWRIEKGKAGIHEGMKGSYNYSFHTNAGDFYTDAMVTGVREGIIEQKGTWLLLADENGKELIYAQGREKFVAALAADVAAKAAAGDDDTYMNLIRRKVFNKNEIFIDYDWETN